MLPLLDTLSALAVPPLCSVLRALGALCHHAARSLREAVTSWIAGARYKELRAWLAGLLPTSFHLPKPAGSDQQLLSQARSSCARPPAGPSAFCPARHHYGTCFLNILIVTTTSSPFPAWRSTTSRPGAHRCPLQTAPPASQL
jgi:hypothetical protein